MNLVCRMLSRVYKMAHFSLSRRLLENQGCIVDFVMQGTPLTTPFLKMFREDRAIECRYMTVECYYSMYQI